MEKMKNLEINDIHGSLKYLRQISYQLFVNEGKVSKGLPINEDKFTNFKKFFNEENKLIKIEIYQKERLFIELFYDKNGNISLKQEYFSNGFLRKKYSWHYCEKGCLAEKREYFSSGYLMKKSLWKYDKQENPIEKLSYSYSGQLLYKNTFHYDDKSRIVERNYYNAQGNLLKKYIWKYNDNQEEYISDKILENGYSFYESDEKKCKQFRFANIINPNDIIIFNSKANITEEYHYSSDGILQNNNTFFYNDKKQIVKEIYISEEGKTKIIYEYKYNEKGFISEKKQWDHLGNLISTHLYSYIYDENNNWIQQIETVDNVPIILTEREIEIY